MSDELHQAEQALENAREAHAAAEARVEDLEALIEEREEAAEAADARIRESHEEGTDPRALTELRRKRRAARDEAADLREEKDHLLTVVARKQSAVEEAKIEVHRVRWALCREKAEEIGRQVWERLIEVEELYQELEALDASVRRHRSVMDSSGYDGSWWPFPSQAAGLYHGHGWGSLFDDLRQLLERTREDAPLEDAEAA